MSPSDPRPPGSTISALAIPSRSPMPPSWNVILKLLPSTVHDSCGHMSVHTPVMTFQYCGGVGTAAGKIVSTIAVAPAADTPIDQSTNPNGKLTPGGLPA